MAACHVRSGRLDRVRGLGFQRSPTLSAPSSGSKRNPQLSPVAKPSSSFHAPLSLRISHAKTHDREGISGLGAARICKTEGFSARCITSSPACMVSYAQILEPSHIAFADMSPKSTYDSVAEWTRKPRYNVLMVGPSGVGKSCLLEKVKSLYLKRPALPPNKIAPTVGQNGESGLGSDIRLPSKRTC